MSEYVRMSSWHVVARPSRTPGRFITKCGKVAFGPTVDVLPAEKSCESCLRSTERYRAVAQAEDRLTL